jgi:hypothetical protein
MTRTSAEVGGVPGARTQKATQPQVPASEEIGFKPTRGEKSADKCESVWSYDHLEFPIFLIESIICLLVLQIGRIHSN